NDSLPHSTLNNYGRIYSLGGIDVYGIYFSGGAGMITNAGGAEIFGATSAVFINGNYVLNNLGTIIGAKGAGVEVGKSTSGGYVSNHGYIFGEQYGIYDISKNESASIHNFGVIKSDDTGIAVHTLPSLNVSITNAAGAVINGGIHGVYCDLGTFHLVNR